MMIIMARSILIMCCLLLAGTGFDNLPDIGFIVKETEARVGRPMTPGSVAGVARRTTRRVIRRSTVYVATLPVGYTTVVVEGTTLYKSGNTYYQIDGKQYDVVTVD